MKLLDLLISKFKKNNAYVGVFISPKSYIEVVQFDVETNAIVKHGRADLAYDTITRQINDISELESNIASLFDDLDIPLSIPTVLTLQTVYLGNSSLPLELDDMEIKSVLADQLENNFLFRNQEPEISYERIAVVQETNSVHLAYTAIQKQQIVEIEKSLKRQGMNIVAIDTSYASLLRGLSIAGVCNDDINTGASWSVLLVNNNSIVVLSLIGNRFVDFYDTPIAIKSFQANEVCSVVASYSNEIIVSQNPDHLIIVSKSDDVSAVELTTSFDLNCKITPIEENCYNRESLFNNISEEQRFVDMESIGASFWNKSDIPINFNFLRKSSSSGVSGNEIKIGDFSFNLTPKLFQNILIGAIVVSLLLVVGTYLVCSAIGSGMEKKLSDLTIRKSQLETEIAAADTGNQLNTDDIINKVFEKNGKVLQSFNALGSVIPERLWIEYFELKDDFSTSIRGKSYSVDDIVAYYQNLIRSAYFQNFKISSIKVIGGDPQSGGNSGVSIVAKSDNQSSSNPGSLPGIPNLPSLSQQKYYEFSFGNSATSASPAPAPSAPGTPAPPPMGPMGPVK